MTEQRVFLLDRIIGGFESIFGFSASIVAIFGIFPPLVQQALAWLKTGTVPSRDLFWLTADVRCAATNDLAKGWEGMDLCRPDHIDFTNFVGVNFIMNGFFDLHIAVVTCIGIGVTFAVMYGLMVTIAAAVGTNCTK